MGYIELRLSVIGPQLCGAKKYVCLYVRRAVTNNIIQAITNLSTPTSEGRTDHFMCIGFLSQPYTAE